MSPVQAIASTSVSLETMRVEPGAWHATIADFDELSQEQLASYAAARNVYAAIEPLVFRLAGEVVGGALMVIRPMPLRIGSIAGSHWGPMLRHRDRADAADILAAMLDVIATEYGTRRGMLVHLWTPPAFDRQDLAGRSLSRLGYKEGTPWLDPELYVLDVRQDIDTMGRNLSSKWRSHLSKAERSGLTFEVADGSGLAEMDDLYQQMLDRKGFEDRTPYHTLRAVMETSEPSLRPKLFFTCKDGKRIAGAVVFAAGEQARYLYGATSSEALPFSAGHFLQWHIAQWLRDNTRARWYNVGSTDGVSGLVSFKSGFVGKSSETVKVAPCAEYSPRSPGALLGRAAFRVRDAVRRYRHNAETHRQSPEQGKASG